MSLQLSNLIDLLKRRAGGRGEGNKMSDGNKDNDEIDARVKDEEKKNKEEQEEEEDDISVYEEFDYLRFTVADFHGIARSKSVSRRHFRSQLKDGITMFAGKKATERKTNGRYYRAIEIDPPWTQALSIYGSKKGGK